MLFPFLLRQTIYNVLCICQPVLKQIVVGRCYLELQALRSVLHYGLDQEVYVGLLELHIADCASVLVGELMSAVRVVGEVLEKG